MVRFKNIFYLNYKICFYLASMPFITVIYNSSISILNYPTTKNYLFITNLKLLIIFSNKCYKISYFCFYLCFWDWETLIYYIMYNELCFIE